MRCPVCRADNIQEPQCRRCKADLTLLFTMEKQRQARLAAARTALAEGKEMEAIVHAAAADWLRGDEESRRLLAVTCLAGGEFERAWIAYQASVKGERRGVSPP